MQTGLILDIGQNIGRARYCILTGESSLYLLGCKLVAPGFILGCANGCAGIFAKSGYAREYFLECVIGLRKLKNLSKVGKMKL